MNTKTPLLTLALMTIALAGCLDGADLDGGDLAATEFAVPADFSGAADEITWPDLNGTTLSILDHGAFPACEDAAARFLELTGATVQCTSADDTGSALNRAILGRGDPEFDILYGVDNLLMTQAIDQRIFDAYTPVLADRVVEDYVFFDDGVWPATPVDHGYIALNVDHRHEDLNGTTIGDLDDVLANADTFVTQDPRTSTPGLGFLLITVSVFGEGGDHDWMDYWADLFEAGVKVTPDWSTAYETHFSGGYGVYTEGHQGDRAIVTSYTESPAYEAYYEAEDIADVLLSHGDDGAALHQIQTMGILRGTDDLAAAQAWIEFTLTDDFQVFAAPYNAVYPVAMDDPDVAASVEEVYGDVDPEPGTFEVAGYDFETDGGSVGTWISQWVALCEANDCI